MGKHFDPWNWNLHDWQNGLGWQQAVCTCPQKAIVGLQKFLHRWIPCKKSLQKLPSEARKTFSRIIATHIRTVFGYINSLEKIYCNINLFQMNLSLKPMWAQKVPLLRLMKNLIPLETLWGKVQKNTLHLMRMMSLLRLTKNSQLLILIIEMIIFQ